MKEKIFLLGGWDLEMSEIHRVLTEQNASISDLQLKWGEAKLSEYEKSYKKFGPIENDKYEFVGIELEHDSDAFTDYTEIDHHGKNNHKVSSLEQVLNLFNLKPTRHQMLIALNDVAHIKGMEAFGATEDEINEIRKADRATQGITPGEEVVAFKIIHNGQFKYYRTPFSETSILCIISSHSKCACYTDNLQLRENKNILVFTPGDEINFFGEAKIVYALSEKLGGWFGGDLENGTGYWGLDIKDSVISLREFIEDLYK